MMVVIIRRHIEDSKIILGVNEDNIIIEKELYGP